MVLFDIGDSMYLFTQRHAQCIHGIYICAAIIALSIFLSVIQYRIHPQWTTGGKWSPFIICGLVTGGIIIHLCLDMQENNRILKYHAETTGITLRKKRLRNGSYTVYYQFGVKGKIYYGSGYTHIDPEWLQVPVPKGHCKVIYNKNDPSESMMDFGDNWPYQFI